jgi:hypothetical protein
VIDVRDDREVANVRWIHFVAGWPQCLC